MWSSVYVWQKIYKFDRNQLSSFEDMEARLNLETLPTVPVNNTLVYCAYFFFFLAAETWLCVLIELTTYVVSNNFIAYNVIYCAIINWS